jgi:hypothetical protein
MRRGSGTAVPQAGLKEIHDGLGQLQQAVDAIAIEVERLSEGQRFTTKLLAEREREVAQIPPANREGWLHADGQVPGNTAREKIAKHVAGLYLPAVIPPLEPAIADTSPQITADVKAMIDGFITGNLDMSLFAPNTAADWRQHEGAGGKFLWLQERLKRFHWSSAKLQARINNSGTV